MWEGQYHYVWPSGWHELLPSTYQDCLEELFQTEPEMAAYIHGMSAMGQEVGPYPPHYPPHWHSESQMWISTRDQPEPRLQYIARPLDCGQLIRGYYADVNFVSWGGMDDTPNWEPEWGDLWQSGPPNSASDGNTRRSVASDGTITVTTVVGKSCQQWQEWSTPSAPRNPDRHLFHGMGSDKRRLQRRALERKGEPIPEELKPRVNSLNKALKRQMYELHQKIKEVAEEKDPKKLEEWERDHQDWLNIVAREERERSQQSSASDGKPARDGKYQKSARDGNKDPAFRARSKSVGKRLGKDGQPRAPTLPENGTLIQEAQCAVKEEEKKDEDEKNKKKRKGKKPEHGSGQQDPGPQDPGPGGGGGGGDGAGGGGEAGVPVPAS